MESILCIVSNEANFDFIELSRYWGAIKLLSRSSLQIVFRISACFELSFLQSGRFLKNFITFLLFLLFREAFGVSKSSFIFESRETSSMRSLLDSTCDIGSWLVILLCALNLMFFIMLEEIFKCLFLLFQIDSSRTRVVSILFGTCLDLAKIDISSLTLCPVEGESRIWYLRCSIQWYLNWRYAFDISTLNLSYYSLTLEIFLSTNFHWIRKKKRLLLIGWFFF